MGDGRHGQRLEGVTQPVEIAWAAGAARSRWLPVEVLRQPRVESVIMRVTPPACSGMPAAESNPGSVVTGLPGSEVELRITSNRPLDGAQVTLTPARGAGSTLAEQISARAGGRKTVTVRWSLKWSGLVSAEIKDVLGTAADSRLEFEQKITPDQPPEVTPRSPGGLTLATPSSQVPLDISVSDDLGVARVSLMRAMSGYRDRTRMLAEDAGAREYDFQETLPLDHLGVAAGQTLEFYAEAHDHNPSLMGIASSPVGRVQIITEKEYAELIRTRTTLTEFQARYAVLDAALSRAGDALTRLTANGGVPSALQAAETALKEDGDLSRQIGKDFVAFDSEQRLAALAREQSALLEAWHPWAAELRARANALPADYADLKQAALETASQAEASTITRSMVAALAQARQDRSGDTFVNAQLAYVGLDQLINGGNSFCQSAKTGKPVFKPSQADRLGETLSQMLAAMCRKRGTAQKPGFGPGQGSGGDGAGGDSGYAVDGDPLLNAPVYGPERSELGQNGGAPRGGANARDSSQRAARNTRTGAEDASRLDVRPVRDAARRQISLRDVPERYREAVKKFYNDDQIDETLAIPPP
jgi:hypothetical protein